MFRYDYIAYTDHTALTALSHIEDNHVIRHARQNKKKMPKASWSES